MSRKRRKASAQNRLYWFQSRNTPVVASSADEARRRKKRGGDKIVAVRQPGPADRKKIARGDWVTTRRDGKSKATSSYGKGRGQGPKRKRSRTT